MIYLEDNDLVHLRGGSYTVYNFGAGESPEEVRRTVQTLTMEVSQIMKVLEHSAPCWILEYCPMRVGTCCLMTPLFFQTLCTSCEPR